MTEQLLTSNTSTPEEEVFECKLYSLKDNWHLFQPYLDDPKVVKVLNECMLDFCDQHSLREWNPNNGPWEYTRLFDIWLDLIEERMEADEEYKQAISALFVESEYTDEEEFYEDMLGFDEYQAIYEKFFEKHGPQKGELDYYKLIGGCHWSAPFVAELLRQAFGPEVEADSIETDAHSVAFFFKDGYCYYADLLIDWKSVDDLFDFLDSEVQDPILPINKGKNIDNAIAF